MKTEQSKHDELVAKNKRLGLIVGLIVLSMIGVSFAAVPLYNLFCSVTGFGGTPQISGDENLENMQIIDRDILVRFNTDTAPDLPWDFTVQEKTMTINPGEKGFIIFQAKNISDAPVAGTALYNVLPAKAGQYFHKVQCFCFGEQVLQPDQNMPMPVLFYIDPKMANDPNMDDVKNITLSYTFFKTESDKLDKALEAYYNQDENNKDGGAQNADSNKM